MRFTNCVVLTRRGWPRSGLLSVAKHPRDGLGRVAVSYQ